MLDIIKTKNNSKIKLFNSLLKKKYGNHFLVESERNLISALSANFKVKMLFSNNIKLIEKYSENELIESSFLVNTETLNSLGDVKTVNEIVCLVEKKEHNINDKENIIFIDQINMPWNIGSIIRSAYAFGFKNIVSNKKSCSFYNPKVVRASQESFYSINMIKEEYDSIRERLADTHVFISSVCDNSLKKLNELVLEDLNNKKIVLILGNEERGIDQDIIDKSDLKINIEINGDSLNVGVSCALFLYKIKSLI